MRKDILKYFKSRHNVAVLCLSVVAIVGFCILFFKPYRIYEWVGRNEIILFWAEIGLLVLIIGVLVLRILDLQSRMDIVENTNKKEDSVVMYNFYDERGEMKLSVKPDSLYYIESADNYVQIHYVSLGKMQMLMVRNSMKNIEWRYKETTLLRCHRSYLVNLKKVQMIKRVDGEMLLNFNDEKVPSIPVGRAYADQVMKYFAK